LSKICRSSLAGGGKKGQNLVAHIDLASNTRDLGSPGREKENGKKHVVCCVAGDILSQPRTREKKSALVSAASRTGRREGAVSCGENRPFPRGQKKGGKNRDGPSGEKSLRGKARGKKGKARGDLGRRLRTYTALWRSRKRGERRGRGRRPQLRHMRREKKQG